METQPTYIETQLQKFNITDAAIAEMKAQFLPLKIEGLEDKEGYKKVHEARMIVKGKRIEVEKRRKELKADSIAFGKAVEGEAKRIFTLLEPLEKYLTDQEEAIDNEKERIKQEKVRVEQIKLQTRNNALYSLGARFDGSYFIVGAVFIDSAKLIDYSDEEFQAIIDKATVEFNKEKALKDAEAARIKAEDAKRKAERLELDRRIQEQAEAEAKLKADQEEIERQKKEMRDIEAQMKEPVVEPEYEVSNVIITKNTTPQTNSLPQPLTKIDYTNLHNVCSEYVYLVLRGDSTDSDLPHYIFEEAISAIYGSDIWTRLNAKILGK